MKTLFYWLALANLVVFVALMIAWVVTINRALRVPS